jgi:hypothetical protein
LKADMAVSHFPFEFRPRDQRGDGIDDDQIDCIRGDKGRRYLESLFTGVRLRHDEIVDVNAEGSSVLGVQGMFGVDESRVPASLLSFGDNVKRERSFAGRLGSVDLDYAASWEPAYPEGMIDGHGSGGDGGNWQGVARPEQEYGAFAELLVHLDDRRLNGSPPFV